MNLILPFIGVYNCYVFYLVLFILAIQINIWNPNLAPDDLDIFVRHDHVTYLS